MSSLLRRVLRRSNSRGKRLVGRPRNKMRRRKRVHDEEKIRNFEKWCREAGIALHPQVGQVTSLCANYHINLYMYTALHWLQRVLCRHRSGSQRLHLKRDQASHHPTSCTADCYQQPNQMCSPPRQDISQANEDHEQLGPLTAGSVGRI